VLTPQETDQLFTAMREMAAQGKAVVFITHKLGEVMQVADTVAILRRGRLTDTIAVSEVTSKADLARRMVGRDVLLEVDRTPTAPRQPVLQVRGLTDAVLRDVALDVRQGEILAMVGVAGNGQQNLVQSICGLRRPLAGQIRILGQDSSRFFRKRTWDANLVYIPEDRRGMAVCLNLDLVDNFLLTTRRGFTRGPWLVRTWARRKVRALMDQFGITPPRCRALARQLSGGNLQKLVVAREFFRRPRLIVAEQPTQGLDIGATGEVWDYLLKARERAGILLVTGDLSEALTLSDRIAVMFEGRIMDAFAAHDRERVAAIGQLMAGVAPDP
jgi:simple sugar transport system ATP-binding protein